MGMEEEGKTAKAVDELGKSGAPERTRTSDARFRKPTLYPLSYRGAECGSADSTRKSAEARMKLRIPRKAFAFMSLGPLGVPRNVHPRKAFAFYGGPSLVRKVGGSMVPGEPA